MNIDWSKVQTAAQIAQEKARTASESSERERLRGILAGDDSEVAEKLNALLQILGYRPMEI